MRTFWMWLILLTGCTADVPGWVVDKAQVLCAEHKGVHTITAVTLNKGVYLVCNDGVKLVCNDGVKPEVK